MQDLLFFNFIPVEEGTENMVMTQNQVYQLNNAMENFRNRYKALFLTFPGSEIDLGGCLTCGKGFAHINAEGDVEPCPFSPYSDVNLRDMPLIQALKKSPLLKAVRENDAKLDESNGLCALW